MRRVMVTVALVVGAFASVAPPASAGPVGETTCAAVMAARRAIGFYPSGSGTCPGGIEP